MSSSDTGPLRASEVGDLLRPYFEMAGEHREQLRALTNVPPERLFALVLISPDFELPDPGGDPLHPFIEMAKECRRRPYFEMVWERREQLRALAGVPPERFFPMILLFPYFEVPGDPLHSCFEVARERGKQIEEQAADLCGERLERVFCLGLQKWLSARRETLLGKPGTSGSVLTAQSAGMPTVEDMCAMVRRLAGERRPAAAPAPVPFRAVLDFAHKFYWRDFLPLLSCIPARHDSDVWSKWQRRMQARAEELQTLFDACLRAARETEFPVAEVERRVKAMIDPSLAIIRWQTLKPDADPPILNFYFRESYQQIQTAWDPVHALAVCAEADSPIDKPRQGNPAAGPTAPAPSAPEEGTAESEPEKEARSRRMSKEEANEKAIELGKKDRFFLQRPLREWADAIGCSEGLVVKLTLWREKMKRTGKARGTAAPKVVPPYRCPRSNDRRR